MEERNPNSPQGLEFWQVLDSMGVGYWECDHVHDRLIFGPCLREAVGGDFPDPSGSPLAAWISRIHPEDQPRVAAAVDAAFEQDRPFDIEYRFAHVSGRWIWLLCRGRVVIRDAKSAPVLSMGVKTDITRRKKEDEYSRFQATFDHALRGSQDRDALAAAILDTALILSEVDACSLYLRRPDGGYALVAGKGFSNGFSEGTGLIPPGDPMIGRIEGGQPLNVHTRDCPTCQCPPLGGLPDLSAEGLASVMLLPIRVFDRHDACLYLASKHAACLLTDEANILDGFARQIGRALELLEAREEAAAQRKRVERSDALLRASHEKLRVMLDATQDGYHQIDTNGYLLDANAAYARLSGYTQDELVGMHLSQLEALQDAMAIAEHARNVIARGSDQFESKHRRKDGSLWDVEVSAIYLDQAGGEFITFLRDITARKRAEEKLQLAASVFTYSREAIVITALDGTILDVNDAFSKITGYHRDEVVGKNPRILKSNRQSREFYADLWASLIEKGHWYGEIWNRRKNGEVYPEMLTISAVRDPMGATRHYVALFSDITTVKEHQRQLEHIAHYDTLTSLPNRVLLADRLHQAMAQAQRRGQQLAVAYLDLDGFKAVNDHHGHETGDQLLMVVSARMKESLREGDTLARLGGDEFVAVLIDLPDIADSLPMLNRLLAAAAEPVHVGALALQVSASVGVAFYPQQEEVDADQLLRQADQAMYQAKLAGKNRFHIFDAEQDRSVRGHHESLEHIRRALVQGEFDLYYQPKVNMRGGAVIGAEALLRWRHPERGLLSPAVFLPVIEDHPLAVELGEWVIDTALAQIERWRTAGLDLPVSVNVGARQLQESDFVGRLRELLARHPGVEPSRLELEVLETSALEDLAQVSKVIEACREMGIGFALDDFGTGYSSLAYLKRLSVGLLKIDQSFVRGMLDDPDDLAILEGVLGLATAFRRDVIAEGVETLEHGVMLLQLGCELAQGYGIARPMPADDLPAWVAAWRPDPAWTNCPTVSRDDLPVLFAGVEHRAWITGMTRHLLGDSVAPPPMAHNQCRFGLWLESEGRARHGAHPAFRAIEAAHLRVHDLANELRDIRARGPGSDIKARLAELYRLRDDLLAALQGVVGGQ